MNIRKIVLQVTALFAAASGQAQSVHDLYFVFKGDQGDLFNFNWWKFDK